MFWKAGIMVFLVVVAVAVLVQSTVTKTQIYKVSELKSCDHLGGAVAVEGRITYAQDNTFVLDDGTGSMEVDTCPTWYKRVNLHVGDRVVVVGQVMKNSSVVARTGLVVNAYKIIQGRETIVVRGTPGKPPWLSYRPPEPSSAP